MVDRLAYVPCWALTMTDAGDTSRSCPPLRVITSDPFWSQNAGMTWYWVPSACDGLIGLRCCWAVFVPLAVVPGCPVAPAGCMMLPAGYMPHGTPQYCGTTVGPEPIKPLLRQHTHTHTRTHRNNNKMSNRGSKKKVCVTTVATKRYM